MGYHIREYLPAHFTHVCGTCTYTGGVERPDVNQVLAKAIPESVSRRINVGYMDPHSLRLDNFRNREDQGILFVDNAGKILHRLKRPGAKEPK